MKFLLAIVGVVLAAVGGVIAYRAFFLEPSSALVITSTEVREVPNTLRVVGGLVLLVFGASLAFLAGRRRSS